MNSSAAALRKRGGEEQGAVALEFVLILPVFLLVMFGALYFAFAFNTQRSLVFVAQSGADAALRVDRSAFDLSNPSGRLAYTERMEAEACAAMEPLLEAQSRAVTEPLGELGCTDGGGDGITFDVVDDRVLLIRIELEPAWRPPLISRFVTTISGSASVPF